MYKEALEKSLSYLSSEQVLEDIRRDPYWPKWNNAWWHMLLLCEMDLAYKIPKAAVNQLTQTLKNHYLPFFPLKEEDIPKDADPRRHIACHCAVAGSYQLLFQCGVNVEKELPWMRPWILKYQLPDGGLNCDEQAYTKETPKSSIMTTLPCLEAILFCRQDDLTEEEINFLNKGAAYLIRQGLFRRISTGEVINRDWLEVRFPRFYDYDFFRGYYFLAKWSDVSGFQIPKELVKEVDELMSQQLTDEGIQLKRYNLVDKRSYKPQADGSWKLEGAEEIDLMKAVSFAGNICAPLTKKWNEVKPRY